ncbi:MAG: hypothetical protein A2W19_01640 [Spirochaetes bacterium RBG_16_49_21]|nr:MAG: hypothetical protein A2W19_01640 [Spirochaetes bacterium RBG_16_49_21]
MKDISLHILDIVENSTQAGATLIEINLFEDTAHDLLTLSIRDNGKGMAKSLLKKARDPFTTTRTTRRVGMGISLLEQAAREAHGNLKITSKPGAGTEITAAFRLSHIDRKPIGDLGSTMATLIMGNPRVDFILRTNTGGEPAEINTREIKAELEEVSITNPLILNHIREFFNQ